MFAASLLPDKALPWRVPVLAGGVGNALGNTLGFHAFTVSAWRYKIYAGAGLSLLQMARITAVALITVIFGFAGAAAFGLIAAQGTPGHTHPFGPRECHAAGWTLCAALFLFLLWLGRASRRWEIRGHSIVLPTGRQALAQLIIGAIDISAAVYACYVLLPADITQGYGRFSLYYIGAVLFGIASHAPGGIGVFESAMITMLGAHDRADMLAGLLAYRVIYNLVPFAVSCGVIGVRAVRRTPQLDGG